MNDSKILLLDGAMGTMLQTAGLPLGELPELWNITHPEAVTAIHRRYADAGSQVLYTNTFGANRFKAARSGHSPAELIAAGVRCAKAAAGPGIRVALDIGPLGQLLEPLGSLRFEEAYDCFREMLTAGEEAGADLVVFETMGDLGEMRAAVLAARENTKLLIWATMTFEASGRSFVGVTVPSMALTLSGLGVDALGFNCSLGPEEMLPLVDELRHWTDLPLILKPNAGLPDPVTGAYLIGPEAFARAMLPALGCGVTIMGGCCGTTPDFIAALSQTLDGQAIPARPPRDRFGVCSPTRTVPFGGVRVIGERINPTGKKRFQQALREGDTDYIVRQALEQQDAGAEILDINVGLPGINEPEMMVKVVKAVQAVIELPLQIDSSDPAAIEAGLRVANGRMIVNSVNGDARILDAVLPLCKKYGAAVVGLCLDRGGVPETWQDRIHTAEKILSSAERHGIDRQDVLIDCLTLTVSAQQEQARETLTALRYVREKLGVRCVLGVSNISFGLPARENVTVSFLTQAMAAGLEFPIVNPNLRPVMDAVFSFRALSGEDAGCEAYIRRFAAEQAASSSPVSSPSGDISLGEAIRRGLRRETAELTERALQSRSELEVVNELLIPALDRVGEDYERQTLFLPQLINAANAACEGFEIIKRRIATRGAESVSKGKVLLATVRGDVHDIGKNIVRVVLENYGYTVIDLGKDVPPELIVETAVREDVRLIGLSALMTTTLPGMAETVKALRLSGHKCSVMVGGAVLTPEYARQIGADFYAKDAKQGADIARQVLG